MFLESSKRINRIDKVKPMPATNMAINRATRIDTGNQNERLCPEIMTTIARGRNPIRKLTSAAKAALTAKI
jgi:hypothetical protein